LNIPVSAMLWLASGKARLGSCRRLSCTVHALAEHTGPWTVDDAEALLDAGDDARFETSAKTPGRFNAMRIQR
jgi:hypothetical protein